MPGEHWPTFLHCFDKLLPSRYCSAPSSGLIIIWTVWQKCLAPQSLPHDVCLTLTVYVPSAAYATGECNHYQVNLKMPRVRTSQSTILRLAQPKLACLHTLNNKPSCETATHLAWHLKSFLSLTCNTFCCCDRTLSTRTTGLTSPPPPLFYSSQLIWHSNTPSLHSCPYCKTKETAICVSPQCSNTKQSKWKHINSKPGDVGSREWATGTQVSQASFTAIMGPQAQFAQANKTPLCIYTSEYRQVLPFKNKTLLFFFLF